jgi:predicted peroxiredoxin
LEDADRDAVVVSRGVAGLGVLRESAVELGVRLLVCEAGLLAEGLQSVALFPGVTVSGVVTFLIDTRNSQIITI